MDTAEKIVDLEWVSSLYNKFSRELLSKCKGDLTHNKLIEAIDVSRNYINKLRQYINARQFGNSGDEVSFFKQYKPGFYHHLFYCSEVLEIGLKRPTGSNQCIRDYYLSQTNRINENFERYRDFYAYFRSGACHQDEYYFTRSSNTSIIYNGFLKEMDPDFSTGFDFLVAIYLSNEKLINFLNRKITEIDDNRILPGLPADDPKISWTDSKAALIEIIYAFKAKGSFNHGKATLKDITDVFQKVFDVELTNPTRDFQEVLRRKTGYSIYLDGLRERYMQYIENIETRETR
jgi:hypothetical protein